MTNTHEAPLPRWSVADVHESFESRTFTDSMERLGASITRLEALFEEHNVRAVEHRKDVHDMNASILRLLGMDHLKLTYRYQGRDFRLTDVHGKVVREIVA